MPSVVLGETELKIVRGLADLARVMCEGPAMLDMMKRFVKEEEGQTATEYMLIISVIVVAVVAAAYVFIDPFKQGVNDLANDVKTILSGGLINGQGVKR